MSLQFERPAQRDWSVIALYGSLIISAIMITATLAWHTGKQLRISGYLKEHGVTTCQELKRPYGPKGPLSTDKAAQSVCVQIVERRHDQCLQETQSLAKDLRERRIAYAACLMTLEAHAALTSAQESAQRAPASSSATP